MLKIQNRRNDARTEPNTRDDHLLHVTSTLILLSQHTRALEEAQTFALIYTNE